MRKRACGSWNSTVTPGAAWRWPVVEGTSTLRGPFTASPTRLGAPGHRYPRQMCCGFSSGRSRLTSPSSRAVPIQPR